MQSSTIAPARFPTGNPEITEAPDQGQPATAEEHFVDVELGAAQHKEAPAQVDDRELVKHQRSYEHWIKGAVGAGMTGLGLYMFKMSVVPNGKSLAEELGNPEANHDALKHDLVDASLATAGGLLAMYDAYRVYRKDVAEKKAA